MAGLKDGRSAAQHAFSETGDIGGGGEQAGVSADAVHDGCVLVVDLALDDAVAEGAGRLRWEGLRCATPAVDMNECRVMPSGAKISRWENCVERFIWRCATVSRLAG